MIIRRYSALYADDACYASPNLADHIPHIHACLDLFGKGTGLTININKSCIVKTRPTSRSTTAIVSALSNCGLQNLPITSKAKWLGILIGARVTTSDIYRSSMDKFRKRASNYLPCKSRFSFTKRITIANVFLSTIFSNLYQLYTTPKAFLKEINSFYYKWTVTYNSFPLKALSRPTKRCGLHRPLKDIKLTNIAAMAANLSKYPTHPQTPTQVNRLSTGKLAATSRISMHQSHACAYITKCRGDDNPVVGDRNSLYHALIDTEHKNTDLTTLHSKLSRYLLASHTATVINN